MAAVNKQHISIVICGHVDSGKSTTTGRLLFELGGIPEREMQKYKDEAEALGKGSFAFAFVMDRQKEERARGVTIACTTKEFFTERFHYTIIDAPGHRDFIKNMITGAAQADVGLLMIPADGNFTTAIQKGNHKLGEVPGQTRQHARLLLLLGLKQLIVGVNKMDTDVAKYSNERYTEIKNVMIDMLIKVGWKKDLVNSGLPILPISGWVGDNLIKKSTNMNWYSGSDCLNIENSKIHVHTLLDALNTWAVLPPRSLDANMRLPVSNVLKIKGTGDVICGRVEQGTVRIGKEIVFLPSMATGKVFCCEMHHTKRDEACHGDNVGLNIKNIGKVMPTAGDVMIYKEDSSLKVCKSFVAQVQTLDVPKSIKVGYTPIAFVRTGRAACKITNIAWKISKETGGKKAENPTELKANEAAEVTFEPVQPLIVDTHKNCEGLSRIAFLDGNTCILLGKVVSLVPK